MSPEPSRASVAHLWYTAAVNARHEWLRRAGASLWTEIRLAARRAIRSDFQRQGARPHERARLASAPLPIVNEVAQDYVSWRRSMLQVAAVFAIAYAALSLWSFQALEEATAPTMDALYDAEVNDDSGIEPEQMSRETYRDVQFYRLFGSGNAIIVDTLNRLWLLSMAVSAFLVAIAAARWKDVQVSRRWSRLAWLIMVLGPVLISYVPVAHLMNYHHVAADEREAWQIAFPMVFAVRAFFTVAPVALGLFPGIIRGCMSLKTLMPESGAPGWVAVIVAPLYVILLLAMVSVLAQLQGDILLSCGVLLYIGGPLLYAVRGGQLVRSHCTRESAKIVGRVRTQASLLTMAGAVLLAVYLLRLPGFSWIAVASLLTGVGANMLLITVVAADLLLRLLHLAHTHARELAGSEAERLLDAKYRGLASVGLGIQGAAPRQAGEASTATAQGLPDER